MEGREADVWASPESWIPQSDSTVLRIVAITDAGIDRGNG